MQATGNKPPASLPAKGKYLMTDLYLSSKYFGLPLTVPSRFPSNTLQVQRVLCVLPPEKQEKLAEELFKIYWEEDGDLADLETIRNALTKCGCTPAEVDETIQKANDANGGKKILKDNTDDAVAKGAFGAPTMYVKVHNEQTKKTEEVMIWGSDRFHIVFPLIGVPWTGPKADGARL